MSVPSLLLRRVLLADAILTGLTGLAMTFAPGLLQSLLGLPGAPLRVAGIVLLTFAAGVLLLGTRERMSRPAVFAVVAINALWALDSVLLLLTGWVTPTVPGTVFTVGQAVVVATLAELQYVGLRLSEKNTAARTAFRPLARL